jgi:hypothetical protein
MCQFCEQYFCRRQRHLFRTCLTCNPADAIGAPSSTNSSNLALPTASRKRCAICLAAAPNSRARQNLGKVNKMLCALSTGTFFSFIFLHPVIEDPDLV